MSSQYDRGPAGARGPATADAPPAGATSVPAARAGPAAGYAPVAGPSGYRERDTSGAVEGFTTLAAVLMLVDGLWAFFTGLAGVVRGSFYTVTHHYLYNINITAWGWIHIALGALIFAAGCALFTRQTWARAIGIIMASISAVLNFLFIPRYPVWAILFIAVDLAIIWALSRASKRTAY